MTNNADSANAEFWNYLCGTNTATYMGFDLGTNYGVEKFDVWYMEYYSYLRQYIHKTISESHNCLEVGIGLGTVSRYLSRNVNELSAVDVAPQPCIFLKKSLEGECANLETMNVSILERTIPTKTGERFDCAIAIGSLHHTGDLNLALDNLINSVKPGGKILVMVYNEFSFIRFLNNPFRFLRRLGETKFRKKHTWNEPKEKIRGINDSNEQGIAAPHTAYSSKRLFTSRIDSTWRVSTENISDFIILKRHVSRKRFLSVARIFGGLDLYATGIKLPDPRFRLDVK